MGALGVVSHGQAGDRLGGELRPGGGGERLAHGAGGDLGADLDQATDNLEQLTRQAAELEKEFEAEMAAQQSKIDPATGGARVPGASGVLRDYQPPDVYHLYHQDGQRWRYLDASLVRPPGHRSSGMSPY